MVLQQAAVQKDTATFRDRITLQTGNTHAGVLRIKDDLESIQGLHKLRVQTIERNMIRLAFGKQFDVILTYENSTFEVKNIEISTRPQTQHLFTCLYPFPEFMNQLAYQKVKQLGEPNVQAVVLRLCRTWTAMGQVYSQLAFLASQFPLSLNFDSSNTLQAEVHLLLRTVKAKARITFLLNDEVLTRWPTTLNQLRFEVHIIYGTADPKVLFNAIQRRLSEATPSDNHACLQDACCVALAKYQ